MCMQMYCVVHLHVKKKMRNGGKNRRKMGKYVFYAVFLPERQQSLPSSEVPILLCDV